MGDHDEDTGDCWKNEIGDYSENASSVVSCNVRIYGRDDISSERTRLCQEFVVRALARDRTGFARITCNCDLRKPTVSPSAADEKEIEKK